MTLHRRVSWGFMAFIGLARFAQAAPQYNVEIIEPSASANTEGIDGDGTVVLTDPNRFTDGGDYIWNGAGLIPVPGFAQALDINHGYVAGYLASTNRPAVWNSKDNTLRVLSQSGGVAYGVNSNGDATGWLGLNQPMLWKNGSDGTALTGAAHGVDINDSDVVVGWLTNTSQPVVWKDGAATVIPSTSGIGWAITNAGDTAGTNFVDIQGNVEPISLDPRGMNEFDAVVGQGGLLWENGVISNLDTLVPAGWDIGNCGGINEEGQIAAAATYDGVRYLVRLTPVPEPAMGVAVGVGVAAMASGRRRRSC